MHKKTNAVQLHPPSKLGKGPQVTKELRACYGCVFGPDRGDARDLGTHCRRLCTLWVNLELQQEHRFAVKPKLHLFQELCELEDGSPARHATYRDEEM